MFSKVFNLLNKNEKLLLSFLIFLMILTSSLEVIGIGSIPIFAMTLLDGERLFNFFEFKIPFIEDLSEFQILLGFAIFIFFIFFLKNLIYILTTILQFLFLKNFVTKLSKKVFSKYLKKDFQFHLNINSAFILRNVTTETDAAKMYLLALINIFRDLIIIIFVSIFLLYYNFYITFVSLSFLLLSSALYYYFFVRKLESIGKKNLRAKADQIKSINNSFWMIKLIKLYSKSEYFLDQFGKVISIRYYIDALVYIYKAINRPIIEITGITLIVLIIILAAKNNMREELFLLLATYAVALSRIGPLFGSVNTNLNSSKFYKPSIKIILDLLNEPIANSYPQKKYIFDTSIRFENISFGYSSAETNIIENINFDIKKSDIVGIYGKTGSGKTTILNLILGLIKPSEGKIYFNENELMKDENFLIHNAGYILQDNLLVDDTIAKNIAFGCEENNINSKKIEEVINKAQLKLFIESLPDGLNTIIGDRGIRLSGGQIQRINIARALYFDSEVLVMDEATSALDDNTASEFIDAIKLLKGKKTIIIVSHRKSIMKLCNKVFSLNNKTLSYEGNYIEFEKN